MSETSQNKSEKRKSENSSRMKEIREILARNHITRGVTPEKLRIILEELGPTFIKLGQIMSLHSDILPQAYCDELMKLNSDVDPMPFDTVKDVLEGSLGENWNSLFESIDAKPLGSASIAQVHRARLKSGEDVVIKVQRKGIYDTMARDISLLHRIVRFMKPIEAFTNIVDLDMVLDEMWSTAQQEMDFLKEADNMEEFAHNNRGIRYVETPKLYRDYCTSRVLVMEYIDGWPIDDLRDLKANGYDPEEIGQKFVNNFIKQVMDDGFFHADPHPGNVKVRDGKIVWMDMGMMGRLSEHDRKVMIKGVKGIALHDIVMVENAVLEIGEFTGTPDRGKLYQDLKQFLEQYGSMTMGNVKTAEVMQALMEIMKANHIRMPHGMTMLCRGLAHMEGVLSIISPDISMMEIAVTRMNDEALENINWKDELTRNARLVYKTARKGAEIPSLVTDVLKEYLQGQSDVNVTLHASGPLADVINSAVRNIVIGVCIAALLISSSVICTTDMEPRTFGIPTLGFMGYAFALAVSIFLTVRYLYHKIRKAKGE